MGPILLCLFAVLYILPGSLAHKRAHRNWIPIMILNVFLGWTLIGWIAALMWAVSYQPPSNEVK